MDPMVITGTEEVTGSIPVSPTLCVQRSVAKRAMRECSCEFYHGTEVPALAPV